MPKVLTGHPERHRIEDRWKRTGAIGRGSTVRHLTRRRLATVASGAWSKTLATPRHAFDLALLGVELRLVVGGEGRAEVLYWSSVDNRPYEAEELAQASAGVRQDFMRLGWTLPGAERSDTRQ